jgi:hypothetical protein
VRRAQRILAVLVLLVIGGCQAVAPSPPASSPATSGPLATEAPGSQAPVPTEIAAAPTPSPTAEPTESAAPPATPGPTYSAQPQASLALQADGAPTLPTKVRMIDTGATCDPGTGESCVRWQVSWLEADPADVTIRIYGVTTCLHEPTASFEGDVKSLSSGDFVPPASLLLLASAPASAGSATLDLVTGETTALGWLPGGGPTVYAVIVQAVNADGGSLFAFVLVSGSCWGCVL